MERLRISYTNDNEECPLLEDLEKDLNEVLIKYGWEESTTQIGFGQRELEYIKF